MTGRVWTFPEVGRSIRPPAARQADNFDTEKGLDLLERLRDPGCTDLGRTGAQMVADFKRDEVLERLAQAMDAPLTPTGSQLALDLLDRFADSLPELWVNVANKTLQTLSDAQRHDTLAVTIDRRVAIWFVVWPGSHREIQPARIGEYLQQIAGKTKLLVEAGVSLEAFLEIDVYVSDRRSEGSPASDGRNLGVEVEYSFIPAKLVGGSDPSNPQWMTVMLNPDLLTPAERQTLGKLMA